MLSFLAHWTSCLCFLTHFQVHWVIYYLSRNWSTFFRQETFYEFQVQSALSSAKPDQKFKFLMGARKVCKESPRRKLRYEETSCLLLLKQRTREMTFFDYAILRIWWRKKRTAVPFSVLVVQHSARASLQLRQNLHQKNTFSWNFWAIQLHAFHKTYFQLQPSLYISFISPARFDALVNFILYTLLSTCTNFELDLRANYRLWRSHVLWCCLPHDVFFSVQVAHVLNTEAFLITSILDCLGPESKKQFCTSWMKERFRTSEYAFQFRSFLLHHNRTYEFCREKLTKSEWELCMF